MKKISNKRGIKSDVSNIKVNKEHKNYSFKIKDFRGTKKDFLMMVEKLNKV